MNYCNNCIWEQTTIDLWGYWTSRKSSSIVITNCTCETIDDTEWEYYFSGENPDCPHWERRNDD